MRCLSTSVPKVFLTGTGMYLVAAVKGGTEFVCKFPCLLYYMTSDDIHGREKACISFTQIASSSFEKIVFSQLKNVHPSYFG